MITVILLLVLVALVGGVIGFLYYRRRPQKLDSNEFTLKWKDLQGFCRDKTTWPKAIESADQLLDLALKKKRVKGKTMGERMASASRIISNNDSMWFAHNLYKKNMDSPDAKLKEAEVKQALVGFRQALKDVGALETAQKPTDETDGAKK